MSEVPAQGRKPLLRIPDIAAALAAMSLKTRVVLLVVSMTVLGVWALALGITQVLERDLTRLLSENFATEAKNVADDLDRDIRLEIDALQRLASTLKPDVLRDAGKAERAMDQFADASAITFASCFVTDREGRITAGYPEQDVRVGSSIQNTAYFRSVIASGAPAIDTPAAGRADIKSAKVSIAVPLRDGAGAIVGTLVGTLPLSNPMLFGQLENQKLGRTGWFLVVSPKDRVILGATHQNRILTTLPGHGGIRLLDRRFEEGFEGPGITVGSNGIEVLSVGHRMASTGWFVIASNPIAEAWEPINDLKRWIYGMAFLISLGGVLVLRFFLGRQFAPLKQATAVIRRMTDGESALAAIPVTRSDEIGELISNFNRLVGQRAQLDARLHDEIAERKQMNQTLQERTDRLDGIYRSVGEGILSTDIEQRIVLYNDAAQRIFGYAASDVIGQPLDMLLPRRLRTRHGKHFVNFAAGGQSTRAMGRYGLIHGLRANGEEFPLEASVSQSGTAPNQLFTVILHDITERLQAEQERERLTGQLELLSEHLAAARDAERGKIAHELHEDLAQELMTLKLYFQLLKVESGNQQADQHRKDALTVVGHATERIRRMVMNLEPQELTTFGLQSAVNSYCREQATTADWILHIDAPRSDVRAPCLVEKACFQILQEGLNNVLRHAKATQVWVAVHQVAGELELVLRDDGIGFDHTPTDERRKRVDSKLGLFGMQRRATQAGGSITIESRVGAGTELRAVFSWPVAAAKPD